MSAERALQRLRDPGSGAAVRVAEVVVDHLLATPLREVIEPAEAARLALTWTQRAVASEPLRAELLRRASDAQARLQAEGRPARAFLPADMLPPLQRLVAVPWTPSERLVTRLLDQPPVRELTAVVLSDILRSFAERLKSADKGLLGGLGERAVKRGGGLFGSIAQGIGDAAGGIVGAVREELEAAMESRIQAFLGTATEQAVRRIAAWVSDPAQAPRTSALRAGALQTLLDTPVSELAAETRALDVPALVDTVRAALSELATHPEAAARVEELVRALLIEAGDVSLGATLREVGMADEARADLVAVVQVRLSALFATDPFAALWSELHA